MKQIFIFMLLALITVKGWSQITVTTADMPSEGEIYILSTPNIVTANIDLTVTGPNQTWDFSALTPINQREDTFLAISDLPVIFQFLFLTSNLADRLTQDINFGTALTFTDAYNIYKNSSSKFQQSGMTGNLNGVPTPIYFSPVDVWYKFPLNYNDTSNSVSSYSINIPTLASYSQDRVRGNKVDGWGKLILPMGTYDVLRIKSTLNDHDSISVAGFPLPAFNRKSYEYKFIGTNHGMPLLQINAMDVFGQPQATSASYQDTLQVNTSISPIFTKSGVSSFPNPANDNISIITDGGVALKIIDITGRTVLSETLYNSKTLVSTEPFINGIYFIQVSNAEGKTITQRLLIQH